jgi:Protein of unknown function (DUF2442)
VRVGAGSPQAEIRTTRRIKTWRELIASPQDGVFATLRDIATFNQAFVLLGAVCWPAEIDIAPDAIHAQIEASANRECVFNVRADFARCAPPCAPVRSVRCWHARG